MPRVVDTCLLIDIAEADPNFGVGAADLLDGLSDDGLVICPISYVELAPVFGGNLAEQNTFLQGLGVSFTEPWLNEDTIAAHKAWDSYVQRKRKGEIQKRPIADLLIGAFALRFGGLLTRNTDDFRVLFPTLQIVSRGR